MPLDPAIKTVLDQLESVGRPELDGLRHFSACAVAVLTTDAGRAELAEQGAELLTVRHPRG